MGGADGTAVQRYAPGKFDDPARFIKMPVEGARAVLAPPTAISLSLALRWGSDGVHGSPATYDG